jgi:preprotein translocase subunit SecA
MTGTAETEAAEFNKTYKLDVIVIPTHMPMVRKDAIDMVYRTEEEKFRNAAKEIKERHDLGQPVLVGTISVEKSEKLAGILKKMGVRLEVLNAKNHEREATIVAQAGTMAPSLYPPTWLAAEIDILLGAPRCRPGNLRRQNRPEQMPKEEWKATLAEFKEETDRNHEEVVKVDSHRSHRAA